MIGETAIRARYAAIKDQLDESGRRLFVAAEKAAAGYAGTAAVSRATGVARSTIIRGAKELLAVSSTSLRIRRAGAGRQASSTADPTVLDDLRGLVEPATMGDPMRPLLWVSKSREKLAVALRALNHAVSANTVAAIQATQRPSDEKPSPTGCWYPESLDHGARFEPFRVDHAVGPDEWSGIFVVVGDEILRLGHAAKRRAIQGFSGQDGEPDSDLRLACCSVNFCIVASVSVRFLSGLRTQVTAVDGSTDG